MILVPFYVKKYKIKSYNYIGIPFLKVDDFTELIVREYSGENRPSALRHNIRRIKSEKQTGELLFKTSKWRRL